MLMSEIDAKSYLKQIRLYDTHINTKLEELSQLKQSVTKITTTLKTDVVSSSGSQDKLGDAVAKIVDLQNEINADIDRFIDAKKQVSGALEKIDDPDQLQVLERRYVLFETFEQIAYEMHMTYRNVCYIHGKGLQTVKAILAKCFQ